MNKEGQRKIRRAKAVANGLAGKRGPLRSVTLEVVARVGKRMARGLTTEQALALEKENILLETWNQALQRDPKLSSHLNKFHAEFVRMATDRLINGGEIADLKWLLTRRYKQQFSEAVEHAPQKATEDTGAAAVLKELFNRASELARLKAG